VPLGAWTSATQHTLSCAKRTSECPPFSPRRTSAAHCLVSHLKAAAFFFFFFFVAGAHVVPVPQVNDLSGLTVGAATCSGEAPHALLFYRARGTTPRTSWPPSCTARFGQGAVGASHLRQARLERLLDLAARCLASHSSSSLAPPHSTVVEVSFTDGEANGQNPSVFDIAVLSRSPFRQIINRCSQLQM